MPKVSVIIPVYNAQDYLKRCLDSVVNQTLKDIEIICVNDCSTDNSINILNEYAQKYSNLKIIDCKVNGGESIARNIGLDNVTGEYIAFVDNDDEIDLDFYEKLYNKAIETNTDIVKGDVHIINYNRENKKSNINDLIKKYNSKLYFNYFWWTAIYKFQIIKDNNIRFLENYPLGGDVLFLNQAILKTNKLALIDDVFYHYHRREDSGDSKILSFEKVKSVLDIHEMIVDNILNSESFDDFSNDEIQYVFTWCLQSPLNYCYRCKTIKVLDYSIDKAFSIYNKVQKYINKNSNIYEICLDILKSGNKEKLKDLYLKNDTTQKMFIANLRYQHNKRGIVNAKS